MECLCGRLLPAVSLRLRAAGIYHRAPDRDPSLRHRHRQLRVSHL